MSDIYLLLFRLRRLKTVREQVRFPRLGNNSLRILLTQKSFIDERSGRELGGRNRPFLLLFD